MLTPRGWWFLIVVILVLVALGAFAVPRLHHRYRRSGGSHSTAWFVYEWVQFNFKSNAAVSRLRALQHRCSRAEQGG